MVHAQETAFADARQKLPPALDARDAYSLGAVRKQHQIDFFEGVLARQELLEQRSRALDAEQQPERHRAQPDGSIGVEQHEIIDEQSRRLVFELAVPFPIDRGREPTECLRVFERDLDEPPFARRRQRIQMIIQRRFEPPFGFRRGVVGLRRVPPGPFDSITDKVVANTLAAMEILVDLGSAERAELKNRAFARARHRPGLPAGNRRHRACRPRARIELENRDS